MYIHTLDITASGMIKDDALVHLNSIHTLDIKEISKIQGSFLLSLSDTLHRLDASQSNITDDSLIHLKDSKTIQTLDLRFIISSFS
jgi:uncharacterized protein YcsI (UPF0317 family)